MHVVSAMLCKVQAPAVSRHTACQHGRIPEQVTMSAARSSHDELTAYKSFMAVETEINCTRTPFRLVVSFHTFRHLSRLMYDVWLA